MRSTLIIEFEKKAIFASKRVEAKVNKISNILEKVYNNKQRYNLRYIYQQEEKYEKKEKCNFLKVFLFLSLSSYHSWRIEFHGHRGAMVAIFSPKAWCNIQRHSLR